MRSLEGTCFCFYWKITEAMPSGTPPRIPTTSTASPPTPATHPPWRSRKPCGDSSDAAQGRYFNPEWWLNQQYMVKYIYIWWNIWWHIGWNIWCEMWWKYMVKYRVKYLVNSISQKDGEQEIWMGSSALHFFLLKDPQSISKWGVYTNWELFASQINSRFANHLYDDFQCLGKSSECNSFISKFCVL